MTRRRIAWLVVLPLALLGSEAAHAAADALFGSPAGDRGELFDGAGPGAAAVPALIALAVAAVVLGLAGRVAGVWPATRCRAVARTPFAVLAPLAFVLQEHLELLLHTGRVPVGAALEPSFLPGLALQLPFALAGYVIARALLRLADGVRGLVSRRRGALGRGARIPLPRPRDEAASRRLVGWAHSGRAPPALARALH
ncbi:MAG TPA: hypothetical protein VE777_17245 [Gaiellales bacterium]|nr:hypothetical protein [Gaiellales bacterium]